MAVAAVLVVLSVPHKKAAAQKSLLQDGAARPSAHTKGYRVASRLATQLEERKALNVVKSFTSTLVQQRRETTSRNSVIASLIRGAHAYRARAEQLAEEPAAGAGAEKPAPAKDAKPCDADCQRTKEAGRERMKELRAEIDTDFNGMIGFGDEAAYVPPPESIAEQVKDGTLYKDPKEDLKDPPPFGGIALQNVDPGATAPVLAKGMVDDKVKDVTKETPTAEDLLKAIQDQEAKARSEVKKDVAAAEASRDVGDPLKSSGLPAGVTFGNEVAAAPAPAPPAAAPVVAAAPLSAAPAPVVAAVNAIAHMDGSAGVQVAAVPATAAPQYVAPAAQAAPPAHATAQQVQPAAAAVKTGGVEDSFPHIGPSFADWGNTQTATAPVVAGGAPSEETEWNEAFAFIHQTDNPVVGNEVTILKSRCCADFIWQQ